jgi:hypothetical protein
MRRRAERLGKPDAARTVVKTLIEDDLPPMQITKEKQEQIAHAATGEAVP